ncbi:glycosyltransferase [Leucobacter chromiireducens]|uniref:Glycosyltransferase n=1 Tax=Leucobacter chromiireducens subsp. solipictus TaxID=398235 RepID=A0ABS1SKB5_9MICO|nr:glycosyltransferase [Leucobacter chromiireducens]MBL3680447.1 glycosyltransferase [Leucobacter chromiireducens subsp. solipictus]
MRIALISLHTSPAAVPGSGDAGGMNVVVAAAAAALARAGHEVTAFTRATAELPAGTRELEAGVRLTALPVGDPELRKELLPRLVPEFATQLAAHGPFDAVHAHYWLSGLAALPLAQRSGITPAVTFHTVAAQKNARLAPGDRPEPALRLAGERALTRSAQLIACSRSELSGITEGYGEPGRPAAIIHPGVDTELFRPAPGAAGPLRITVLGRVQPLKGQDLAVQAALALARRNPELWARSELVIAGEPTPGAEAYAAELRALATRGGIADRVRFLPAQDRAASARLLAESSVVVVPSHSESFGLVSLEAAASGVPAVVAAHTGLLEASPPTAELRVAGRDPEVWADAIAGVLQDPARRATLGREARSFALAHNWDAHAQRLLEVYGTLGAGVSVTGLAPG